MDTQKIATENEILRGVVGSSCHGTAIDGTDDRDEMGIFIEPPEYVCGLTSCDHYVYRTQPEGVRSGPGDLDLVMYSLRKYCRLAAHGNPTVLLLLWLPDYIKSSHFGRRLVGMREAFVSQESGKRFLGYLTGQKASLCGARAKRVNRPELIEKYGFDTKSAAHALRLAYQGVELLTTRNMVLPIQEPQVSILRAIRRGEVSLADTLRLIDEEEDKLRALVDACTWRADIQRINDFLVLAHYESH